MITAETDHELLQRCRLLATPGNFARLSQLIAGYMEAAAKAEQFCSSDNLREAFEWCQRYDVRGQCLGEFAEHHNLKRALRKFPTA